MDVFAELWKAAQTAGPFGMVFTLAALWAVNQERKATQKKYDDLVGRFISLAGDTQSTLKDWRDVLMKSANRNSDP